MVKLKIVDTSIGKTETRLLTHVDPVYYIHFHKTLYPFRNSFSVHGPEKFVKRIEDMALLYEKQ